MNLTQPGRPSPVSTVGILSNYLFELEMVEHKNPPDQRVIDLTGVKSPIVGTVTAPILENGVSLKGRGRKGITEQEKKNLIARATAAYREMQSLQPTTVKGKRKASKTKTAPVTEKKARLTERAPMKPSKKKTSNKKATAVAYRQRGSVELFERPRVKALYMKLQGKHNHLSLEKRKWRVHTEIAQMLIQSSMKMQEGVMVCTNPGLVHALEELVSLDGPRTNSISPIIRLHLAVLYANGLGVERNPERAEFHLNTFTRHPESSFYFQKKSDKFFRRIMQGFIGDSGQRAQRVNALCTSWQKEQEKAKEYYLVALLTNLRGGK